MKRASEIREKSKEKKAKSKIREDLKQYNDNQILFNYHETSISSYMDKDPCPSNSDSAHREESTNDFQSSAPVSSQSCSTGKKPRRQKSDRKKSNLRG